MSWSRSCLSRRTALAPTSRGPRARVAAGVGAIGIVLAACGSTPEGPSPGGPSPVGFDEAQGAVVKITAHGTFVPVDGEAREADWWGSGLVIDPDGIAVTNNHVVVGAATLDVEVDGTRHSARILGSSECLDLAVIDIEGDGFAFFDWYDSEIRAAQEVWALGFPDVGDRSYSVTRGIVSKPSMVGHTRWASLDRTIEHDARIRGGNSGGPLIEETGRVVGVNYAGDDDDDTNYAIHRDEVLRVLDDLVAGTNVLSLGINGQARSAAGMPGPGIFVSSVASGSPANRAGIAPGDLVMRMEGVTLAQDETMAEYCSVLRTHGQDAVLAVEVYRPSDGGIYVGQVNGDPLTPASLPEPPGDEELPEGEAGEVTTVVDDSGRVSVDVPVSWTDVDGRTYTDSSGNTVYDVRASRDVEAFTFTWAESGVTVSASSDALANQTVDDVLDLLGGVAQNACTLDVEGRLPYGDGLYTGAYEWWSDCGPPGAHYVLIAAEADDGSHLVWVRLQLVPGDEWVVDPVVRSFRADF